MSSMDTRRVAIRRGAAMVAALTVSAAGRSVHAQQSPVIQHQVRATVVVLSSVTDTPALVRQDAAGGFVIYSATVTSNGNDRFTLQVRLTDPRGSAAAIQRADGSWMALGGTDWIDVAELVAGRHATVVTCRVPGVSRDGEPVGAPGLAWRTVPVGGAVP